jgi:hypothetical protein
VFSGHCGERGEDEGVTVLFTECSYRLEKLTETHPLRGDFI